MQQEVYQEPLPPQLAYIETSSMYKVCGKFHVTYAGPGACFIWLLINMYGCVLFFKAVVKKAIYTYLNHSALIIQGVICLLFFISALLSLYTFSAGVPEGLRVSHRLTWISVILFLLDYFVNLVVFGTQKEQFNEHCIFTTRQSLTGFQPNVDYFFAPEDPDSDLYNCSRLWETELKFSVALFVVLFVLYVHLAFCFWNFTQETMLIREEKMKFYASQPYPHRFYEARKQSGPTNYFPNLFR